MNRLPDNKPRKVLGKGLSALLPTKPLTSSHPEPQPSDGHAAAVPISEIDPNPLQPRTVFDPQRIQELAASIEANGVIQPLIVRRKGARYELIAGERRLRAAHLAGLIDVPVIVQDYADDRLLEVALIENIQREDLNPIETAQALDRLAREMNLSHEEIGRRTGKDRTTITNLLRLLKLPSEIQILLAERRLSMGHARAILGLADPEQQLDLANKTTAQGYSVRQVERMVQKATEKRESGDESATEKKLDPNLKAAIQELEAVLGTRVRIQEKSDDRGRIEIEYYSQDELNRLYDLIVGANKIA
ncbi:MAG TPA: ParB/RepB/Spo0J family partition protein [Bryobacteraceae bacterium]|nr:ParB/RepB/Spo0J family partition protein [Bryobacteraceae bacterium]